MRAAETHRLTAYAVAAPMIILQLAGLDDCFIICIGDLNSYRFCLIFNETRFEIFETSEMVGFFQKRDTPWPSNRRRFL